MADRGIIFSAPMVRAILADQKTMTRRLASSPLAKAEPGDRFYVRESHHRTDDDGPPIVALTFRAIRGNIDRLAPWPCD